MAHLDQDLAELFHRAHDVRCTQPKALIGHLIDALLGELHQFRSHQREKAVT